MPKLTVQMRWVGSLIALAVGAVGTALHADPSHQTEDASKRNGSSYLRERVGGEAPTINSYSETGVITAQDDPMDLLKTLSAHLGLPGFLSEPETGEKKQTEASTLNTNQVRVGAGEPKRDEPL